MFRGTLPDALFSSPFSTPCPTLVPSPMTTLSLLCPLTGYEPKSLIVVSSVHTPINLSSRRGSLDTNLDHLATTVDASETIDTTEVGQLTSPLFSQEREDNPFSVCGSQAHLSVGGPMQNTDLFSSIGRPVRDVESFSSFEKPLSKGKRNRKLECGTFSNGKGQNSV